MVSVREKRATREKILELAKDADLRDWFWTNAEGKSYNISFEEFLKRWHELDGETTRIPISSADGYSNWIHVYNATGNEYLEFTLQKKNGNRSNGAATPHDSHSPYESVITGDIYTLLS